MRRVRKMFIFFFLQLTICQLPSLYAQDKDTTWTGTVAGSVKDTTYNYFLQAATVSIYSAKDSSLIAYTLTNSLGEFRITNLPVNIPLTIRVSYIGYDTYFRLFSIPIGEKVFVLGQIDVNKGVNSLEEVTVISSPVRMNGDTLEFTAAAFKLDRNAVAEDLLKRLPGIIVWGDGTITVNGRQINKLLVDGKPFFGGETKVATQNIPKSAIEKVQVYQEFIDPNNPYDSTTSINFKLRKNQHSGYFGLLYAGADKREKYEVGTNNNIFSQRDQFAIVGQMNNTNKIGNDINTLLRNNTFKGTGARVEYQPDFTLLGTNKQTSGGMLYTHDFIPDYDAYNQNRVTTTSFYNNTINTTLTNTETENRISKDSVLYQHLKKIRNVDASEFNVSGRYNKRKNGDSLMVMGNYLYKSVINQSANQNDVLGSQMGLISRANQEDSSGALVHRLSFAGSYDHHGFYNSSVRKLTNWSVAYSLITNLSKLDKLLKTDFQGNSISAPDRFFSRRYNNTLNSTKQELSLNIGNFADWLFGSNRTLSRFNIQFYSKLNSFFETRKNLVSDWDSTRNIYKDNNYLTANINYKVVDELAGFSISKTFSNVLANRYQKDFVVNVEAPYRLYYQSNTSNHAFQNFKETYHSFVPVVRFTYSNYQYGEFIYRVGLDATVISDYPTPDQRVIIVDSSDVYSLRFGNTNLLPQKKYQAVLRFRYDSYGLKNPLNYGGIVTAGITKDYFTDSINVDAAGRFMYFPVNLNGYRYLRFTAFFNKAFIVGSHQYQFRLAALLERSRNPGYMGFQNVVNPGLTISNVIFQSDTLSIYYTYKNLFAINLAQQVSFYNSKQTGAVNGEFKNVQMTTQIGVGVNLTKRISFTSNLSYNLFTYSNSSSNRYAIWNSFISYRFLKSNNLEVKFSALDILNQNRGLINTGGKYSLSRGMVNVQRQYFMATISYFPKKFGKTIQPN